MMRNVLLAVQREIIRGTVLSVEKTKLRHEGGKQVVTVGPYREAVGGKKWAMFTRQGRIISSSAFDVAQQFIAFVGRDLAWVACERARQERADFFPTQPR